MKILHLIDIPWWSGLSSYAFDCIQAQADSGHQTVLACAEDSLPHRRARERGIETFAIGGRKAWEAPGNWWSVGDLLSRLKPDWIVAHTGSTHWIAWTWGRALGIPVIRTRATAQRAKSGWVNRRLYADTRWVVTGSEKLADECRNALRLDGSVRVAEPPVDAPASKGASPSGPRFGILARLDPVKGHSVFLRAAGEVRAALPDAEFHLAGPEENVRWPELLRQCRGLGLDRVYYHGFLDGPRVWDFIAGCSAGVIASLGSEEISRALLEWMAMGKPVVAARVGCIPEILDERGGFLVPSGDAGALAAGLKTLAERPDLAARMGEENRRLCRERFSRARFRETWDGLLRDDGRTVR